MGEKNLSIHHVFKNITFCEKAMRVQFKTGGHPNWSHLDCLDLSTIKLKMKGPLR